MIFVQNVNYNVPRSYRTLKWNEEPLNQQSNFTCQNVNFGSFNILLHPSVQGFSHHCNLPPLLMILIWGFFWSRQMWVLPSSDVFGVFFSCDQAALWMVQSVRPSVRLSVCLFVCPSRLFHFVPIIVSSWNFQELLPMTEVMFMQKVKVRD